MSYSFAYSEGSYGAISMRAFRGSPMAPRWIKTKDYKPSNFLPISEDDDWLLLSGEFVVGRVLPPGANRVGRLFNWSMTGPHGPKVPRPNRGSANDLESAKAALLASWRRWQEWAELQDRGP
jgi:hypothetical protein